MIRKETELSFGQEGQGLNVCDNDTKNSFFIVYMLLVADNLQYAPHDLASCDGHGR